MASCDPCSRPHLNEIRFTLMMMMINVLYSFLPIFVIGDGLINFKMLMVECKQSPQPTIAMAADVL